MLIIFGASKVELKNIISKIAILKTIKKDRMIFYFGTIGSKDIIVALTGMGQKNAEMAADFIFSFPEMRGKGKLKVIITGFCGATNNDLKVGDVVVYDKIIDLTKGKNTNPDADRVGSYFFDFSSIDENIIKKGAKKVVCGCTATVVSAPREKAFIFKKYKADVIDMESYWIIEQLLKNGLSSDVINCIRTVSDDAEEYLPGYFSASNRKEAVFKLLKSIFLINELKLNINVLRNIKKAGHVLDEFIFNFISDDQ